MWEEGPGCGLSDPMSWLLPHPHPVHTRDMLRSGSHLTRRHSGAGTGTSSTPAWCPVQAPQTRGGWSTWRRTGPPCAHARWSPASSSVYEIADSVPHAASADLGFTKPPTATVRCVCLRQPWCGFLHCFIILPVSCCKDHLLHSNVRWEGATRAVHNAHVFPTQWQCQLLHALLAVGTPSTDRRTRCPVVNLLCTPSAPIHVFVGCSILWS